MSSKRTARGATRHVWLLVGLALGSVGGSTENSSAQPGIGPESTPDPEEPPEPSRIAETDPDLDRRELERGPAGAKSPEPRDWTRYPAPDESSGVAVGEGEPSRLWWIPRAGLLLPRIAFEIASAPFRGALWLLDRYRVDERAVDLFFNDARTFGIYPIASFESGFGATGGAHLVYKGFGGGEALDIDARYGGRYNQAYELELTSGARFSRLELRLALELERKPRERFFGIGNADLTAPGEIAGPIDPRIDDRAVSTRYREDIVAAVLSGELQVRGPLALVMRNQLERRELDAPADLDADVALADVYMPAAVVGYGESIDSLWNEIELRWDDRGRVSPFVSAAMPSRGWRAVASVGYRSPLSPERSGYFQYTADVQRYFNLYSGTRVLGLRLLASQISAPIEDVAIVHLPVLGGDSLLRGYQTDRFRDRAAVLGSAEYKWEIAPKVGAAAFVFVDVGKTLPGLDDLGRGKTRVGYGAGVQLHTLHTFLMRAHVASSIDGGVFFNLDFDPVAEARPVEAP